MTSCGTKCCTLWKEKVNLFFCILYSMHFSYPFWFVFAMKSLPVWFFRSSLCLSQGHSQDFITVVASSGQSYIWGGTWSVIFIHNEIRMISQSWIKLIVHIFQLSLDRFLWPTWWPPRGYAPGLTIVWASPLCPQYLGKWYEIQKLPVLFQQGECVTATYSRQGTGGDMEVLIKELLWV